MSESLRYVLADVFTDRAFGGNQLAVFLDGASVPPDLMPLIARELNLSETVFVLPPDDPAHAARMRIFTPGAELPFAGHPTVGTACVLLACGRVVRAATSDAGSRQEAELVLEQGVGPVRARARSGDDGYQAWFDVPRLPELGPEPPAVERLAEALSFDERDISDGDWRPRGASCGVPFLIVPVRDRRALARARLDQSLWDEIIAPSWAPHVYVVTRDAELEGSAIRARMFAPAMGVAEDPATGAAAAALAGFLAAHEHGNAASLRWRIEQGFEMGRPSLIEVEAERRDGALTSVRVGGGCVVIGEGSLYLPAIANRGMEEEP